MISMICFITRISKYPIFWNRIVLKQHAKIITEERCRFWRLLNTDGTLDDIFSGKTVSGKRSSQLRSA
ncbi:hypothetical protein QQG55_16395 [Brugia pahangi]